LSVPIASTSNACCKAIGKVRPRFVARLKIPRAALGLKENRLGTVVAFLRTCNKEHPLASLGEAEILAVQHAPAPHIPAGVQLTDCKSEIQSSMGRQEAWNIFDHHPTGPKCPQHANEFKEEAGPLTVQALALPSDTQILTWEAADKHIDGRQIIKRQCLNVIVRLCMKMFSEHGSTE